MILSTNHNNIHPLSIYIYNVVDGIYSEIKNEVLKQRSNFRGNIGHNSQFSVNPIHSVYNGTESASYLRPKILEQIPSEIRNKKSREGFKREIKKLNPTDCS